MTRAEILAALPERGWGLVRDVDPLLIVALDTVGLIRAQYTPIPRAFQARLTATGRAARVTS